MPISVAQAASQLGISASAVRKAIDGGSLQASRVGRIWVIDQADLAVPRPSIRPVSMRMAWAFLDLLDGAKAKGASPQERYRLRARRDQLVHADDPASLMRAWLIRRSSPRLKLRAAPADIADLRADPRLVPSGISDSRSSMSAADRVEAYVAAESLEQVRLEFRLSAGGASNVLLRPVPDELLPARASSSMVAADLADWGGPREAAAAARLIRRSL